jgi:hypothetical protein
MRTMRIFVARVFETKTPRMQPLALFMVRRLCDVEAANEHPAVAVALEVHRHSFQSSLKASFAPLAPAPMTLYANLDPNV